MRSTSRGIWMLCAAFSVSCSVDHPQFNASDTHPRIPHSDGAADTETNVRDSTTDLVLDTPIACGEGLTTCGTDCPNTATDTAHCGACDAACSGAEDCVAGRCRGVPMQVPGLRLWLDARNPAGDGSLPENGPLVVWHDLSDGAGDAIPVAEAPIMDAHGALPFVHFGGAAMGTRVETAGSLSTATNTHLEFFVVMRSNDPTGRSAFLSVSGGDRYTMYLPWARRWFIDLPHRAGIDRMVLPWGRDGRHTTLWHVSSGPDNIVAWADGREVGSFLGRETTDLSGRLFIGSLPNGGGWSQVDVMEIIAYDQAPSSEQRAAITDYLSARWRLDGTAAPDAGMVRHYDASAPGTGDLPADGSILSRVVDHSPSAAHATTTGEVTWHENGMSPGHPSFRLDADSALEFTNPALSEMTLSMVFRTENIRRGSGWANSAVLLGGASEDEEDDNDGALVLRAGNLQWNTLLQNHVGSLSDGMPHHVLMIRHLEGTGSHVTIWVDGVRVLDQDGRRHYAITGPAKWHVGAHEGDDSDEGAIEGDFAEIRIYDRQLTDTELNRLERALRDKWDLLAIGDRVQ